MIRNIVNELLRNRDRFDSGLICVILFICVRFMIKFAAEIQNIGVVKDRLASVLVGLARLIPSIRKRIEEEKRSARKSIEKSVLSQNSVVHESIPDEGMPLGAITNFLLDSSRDEKVKWSSGSLTGSVYSCDFSLEKVHAVALTEFSKSNLLHPDVFPRTRQMEAEVVRMTLDLFSGDSNCVGSVTVGGTESILLAVKAYRDYARTCNGVVFPNLVVPSTVHAAFMKAGEYFGVEIRRARCDPERYFEVDLASMEELIDSSTIALVGSAPQYPHGTLDPIPGIARLAKEYGIGCHVDACLGSFLLAFLEAELPYKVDFKVDGVTSISCDTHKYGYAPKGSSVLMWKSARLRQFQYSICSDWEGGLYATPTMTGSRNSSAVVAAWASMMHLGKNGYALCASRISAAVKMIERTILEELSNDLVMLGRTDTSVASFTTRPHTVRHQLNIFDIADHMRNKSSRQWHLAMLQKPAGVHFAVTMANVDNCAEFSEDLIAAVHAERKRVDGGGKTGSTESAAIYGSTASVPKILVKELVVDYLDTCYLTKPLHAQ